MIRKGDIKGAGLFPDTPRTLIADLKAKDGDPDAQHDMLREFLEMYIPSIRAYILRLIACGMSIGKHQDVDDAVHSFLRDKFISRNIVTEVWMKPSGGRLRHFLAKAIRNHMIDQQRRRKNDLRTSSLSILTQEELENAVGEKGDDGLTPDELFDLEWGRSIAAEGIVRAKQYLVESGQEVVWHIFRRYRLAPVMNDMGEPATLEELEQEYGIPRRKLHDRITNAQKTVQRYMREAIGRYAPESKIEADSRYIVALLSGRLNNGGGSHE